MLNSMPRAAPPAIPPPDVGTLRTIRLPYRPRAPVSKLHAGHDHTESRKAILRYTTPASLAGLPAVTLPGEHIGAALGTGVQLLAAPMHDAPLLAFASTLSPR